MPDRAGRRDRATIRIERRRALKWLVVPAAGFALPSTARAASVASTRVWPSQEYTRVILEGPQPIPHQLSTLREPHRLVLDLEGVELTTDVARLATQVEADDPFIAGVRFGRPVFSLLRVVLDLRGEVNPQVFQLPPVADFGHRLVVDLYPVNPVDPLMALLELESREAIAMPPPLRIEPELSMTSETTVSLNCVSRSFLKESGCIGSMIRRTRRAGSR